MFGNLQDGWIESDVILGAENLDVSLINLSSALLNNSGGEREVLGELKSLLNELETSKLGIEEVRARLQQLLETHQN